MLDIAVKSGIDFGILLQAATELNKVDLLRDAL
jgi:hypothetical protein